MKTIKIAGILVALLGLNACESFEDLQNDANRAVQAHPSLLLTNLEVATFNNTENGTFNVINASPGLASRMLVYTDGAASEQYYGWQRGSFFGYNNLRQAVKMDDEADRLGLENYKHIGTFFKSYTIIQMTNFFGDIPYTESLARTTGEPSYDEQETIYLKVLDDLKAANAGLDEAKGAITGDLIYGGDLLKWKKLINSFSLRVLMSLSNKTENTTLNVVTRFAEIVNNPATYPIFESNDDNGALPFYDLTGNRYPNYNSNSFKTAYYMDESFVNLLKDRLDPRLMVMADAKPAATGPDTDFDSYGGFDGSAPLAENSARLVNGEGSRVDARYYSDPVNEPAVAIGYAEVQFILAEAAQRSWLGAADPVPNYLNGIHASMDFYHIPGADQDDYVAQSNVAFDPGSGIEMIITQKYINFFMNGGWEPFYNHQRTGFPEFKVDGGGVLNNQQVPTRWMYPQDELQLNAANIDAAISRQFPGGDNINGVTWLLKSE